MSNLTQYSNHLKLQGKSSTTIAGYLIDLKCYFNYLSNFSNFSNLSNEIPNEIPTLTRSEILSYKQYLQITKNYNAKTINRTLSSLKSYNEFLVLISQQESIVILSTDYIKIQKSISSPTKSSLKEVKKFIEQIKLNSSFRNYAIVSVIANTGLRISEVLSIRINNLYLDDNECRIFGKGNKQRTIILNERAIEVIQEYINNHRSKSKYAATSPYLFVSNKGDKLDTSTIQRIFNDYSKKITPHDLRHCFATNVLENGFLTIRGLQEQLGHSSLETTQIYTHPSKAEMKKGLNRKEACI